MDLQAVQERFGIIGTSSAIRHVIDRARQVARTDITVLIEGESGVGKEPIAHAIHEISARRHRALKIVNTGAIPEGLIESELFGAEKGAYTGASERRTGLFEDADGGSVFLDEIGEMPSASQVRLLRVLETGAFNRVGSSTQRNTDVRIIAATNKNLGEEVNAGRFREDLYYRLSTVIIRIPPLRERTEDILPIFKSFLFDLSQKYSTPRRTLDDDAVELLTHYRWPGNVRELRNVAEQVVVLHRSTSVSAETLKPFLRGVTTGSDNAMLPVAWTPDGKRGALHERELIYRALLELRVGLRELKTEVASMAQVLRHLAIREDYGTDSAAKRLGDIPLLPSKEERPQLIEDTTYEIASSDDTLPQDEKATQTKQATLPTLEDAKRQLITRALGVYEGNRRETAKALGISERTLYRTLKELDVDV